MIKKQTTFILGAGASMAYGFPSGKTLKALIWKKLEPAYLPDYFFQAAEINPKERYISPLPSQKSPKEEYESKIREFRNLLKLSPDETIDYFLEHVSDDIDNKNNYRLMGRLAIAYVLLGYEQGKYLFDDWMEYHGREKMHEQETFLKENTKIRPDDKHWYQLLFNRMCRECPTIDEFHDNQISVITFNYDRSFEYYFLCALMAKYKVDAQKAAEVLNQFDIVHVYGQLGELSELIPQNKMDKRKEAVSYAALSETDVDKFISLRNAANGIQLIWDDPEKNQNIKKARTLIYSNDNKIIFLGFGYDPTNLERIMPQREINSLSKISTHGTIYGISKQSLQDLNAKYRMEYPRGHSAGLFGEHFLGHQTDDFSDCKIYDFLYNSIGLLR